jgi:hypothetical protein
MSLFETLFTKTPPAPDPRIEIRDTLFGDTPVDRWLGNGSVSQPFPWSAFVLARAFMAAGNREGMIKNWRNVIDWPGLEPRHYLQAWHFLRQHGVEPPPAKAKQLLGVVVEVGMEHGCDILAAYQDHSARYYNHAGSSVVWEHAEPSMDERIGALLAASARVVQQIGPWDKPRPPAPQMGDVRLSFLTPSGLHLGQGGMETMSRDPIGSQVLNQAAGLMNALIERAMANRKTA